MEKRKWKRTRRILALVLALAMVLQQSAIGASATETEMATEAATELLTEAQTEAEAAQTQAGETDEIPGTESETEPASEAPTEALTEDATDAETEAEATELTTGDAAEEGTEAGTEVSAEAESETATEAEAEPEIVLDTAVVQEVFQKTVDDAVQPMVKYTVKVTNLTEGADAKDVSVKVLLADALSYVKEAGETPELSAIGTLADADAANVFAAGELTDALRAKYAQGGVVLWKNQTIAAGAEKDFVFFASVKDGETDTEALRSAWLVNGKEVAAEKIQWSSAELLAVEKELPSEFTVENDTMIVTATLSDPDILPEGAVFVVEKIELSDAEIEQIEAVAEEGEKQLANYAAYDMHFEVDGEEIEPQDGTVAVKIEYKKANDEDFGGETLNSDAAELQVLHLAEEAGVTDVTTNTEVGAAGEVNSAEFVTDSFSVFVLSQMVDVDHTFIYEDDDVKITAVTDGEEKLLNSNLTELKLEIVEDRDSKEYKELEEAVKNAGEEGETLLGFRAYNFTFLKDGEEVEPTGKIKVTLEHKNDPIPDDISENLVEGTSFYQVTKKGKVKALNAKTTTGKYNAANKAVMAISNPTLIETYAKTGIEMSRSEILAGLGIAKNFGVFAIDFNNDQDLEGCIAVKNLTGCSDAMGPSANFYSQGQTTVQLTIVKKAKKAGTYSFGIYEKNETGYHLKETVDITLTESDKGSDGWYVGSKSIDGKTLPQNEYFVYEKDQNGNLIQGGNATVNGQNVTVTYELDESSSASSSMGVLGVCTSYVENFLGNGYDHDTFKHEVASSLVIGSGNHIEDAPNNDEYYIVGPKGARYKVNTNPATGVAIYREEGTFPINFETEMASLKTFSARLAKAASSSDVRVLELSVNADGSIDKNSMYLDGEKFEGDPFNTPGLENDGRLTVINVNCSNNSQTVTTDHLVINGKQAQGWEDVAANIIWNFYVGSGDNISAYAGKIYHAQNYGTVLAPGAEVSCEGLTVGTVIANNLSHHQNEIHHKQLVEYGTTIERRIECINAPDMGKLEIVKTVNGDLAAEDLTEEQKKNIKFTVTGPNGYSATFTYANMPDGSKTLENLVPGEYTVTESNANVEGYTVETTYDVDSDGKATVVAEKTAEVKVTNTYTQKKGSLKVTKSVAGNAPIADKEFTFTVTLDDTSINETYSGVEFKNGVATFKLKGGESKTIDGLPDGMGYTVTEADYSADGYVTTYSGNTNSGKIDYEKESVVEVTNTRDKTGKLTVKKSVAGNAPEAGKKFTFTVTLDDTSINRTYDGVEFKDGVATFELGDRESKTIDGLPNGVGYTVTEADYSADGYVTTYSGNTNSGKIDYENESVLEVINTKNAEGSLTVEKILAGNASEADKEFTFTVTLDDKTISGKYSGVEFKGGVGTFTLKGGESKTIDGLPNGVGYTVTEADYSADGYVTKYNGNTSDNASGKIDAEKAIVVKVTNTRDKTGKLTVTKSVAGNAPIADKEFAFTVTLDDKRINGPYSDVNFEKGVGTFTLKGGESKTIDGLPNGMGYTVTEADYSEEGYVTTYSGNTNSGKIDYVKESVVEVTNTRDKNGSLTVVKRFEGDLTAEKLSDEQKKAITFEVYGPVPEKGEAPQVAAFSYFDMRNGSKTIPDLVPGIYIVKETNGNVDGYTVETTYDVTDGKTDVKPETSMTVTVTNAYTQKKGSLKIQKNVTVNGKATTGKEADGIYKFEVKDAEGRKVGGTEIEVENGASTTTAVEGLVPGEYTVSELTGDNPKGMSLVGGNDVKVKVSADEEAEIQTAEFTNNLVLVGDLSVTKTVSGNAGDKTKNFNFTVTLSDTTVNGTFGDMAFTNGAATFTLKHGETKTATGLPAGITYTVTETEANADGYTTEATGRTGTITAGDTAEAGFVNTKNEFGNLSVSKTVSGNAGDKTKDFNFTVTLSDTAVNGTYGEMTFTDGVATFMLKDGETKTALELPAGITYTVTETEANADGYTTEASGDAGTIPADGTAAAAFVNTKDEFGSLSVTKKVSGNAGDKTKDFNFTVTLSDTTVNGTFGDMDFTDGVATFTLKDGETKTAAELPAGITYTVTEAEANADGYTTEATGDAGTIPVNGTAAAEFVNIKDEFGSLSVSKTVEGTAADAEKAFSFTVTLSDTEVNGTFDDMMFTNGVAAFTLKNGETKTATGLPAGVTYTVTEEDYTSAGYTTSSTGETGTLAAGEVARAAFVNTYKAEEGSIVLGATKVFDKELAGGEFTFLLVEVDESGAVLPGGVSMEATNAADGSITFGAVTYTEEGTHHYLISEVIPENDGTAVIYDTTAYTVTVTVEDVDGRLVATADITPEQAVFTNKTIHFNVNKTEFGTGEEVEGAELEVLDKDGNVVDSWTSKKGETHDFGDKLKAGGSYTLREKVAPDGYGYVTDIEFTVEKDGTITAGMPKTTDEEGNETYLVEDKRIRLQVDKRATGTGEEVEGAELTLFDKDGNVVDSWTSKKGETHDFGGKLKAGETYTLRETVTPDGYLVTTDIEFTVNNDGTITTTAKTSTDAEGNTVYLVEDDLKPQSHRGRIEVTKSLSLITGEAIQPQDATFYVALFADEARTQRVSEVKAIRFTKSSVSDVTFENLGAGTYYVAETDAEGNVLDLGYEGEVTFEPTFADGNSVTLESDTFAGQLHFENQFYDVPIGYTYEGELQITKKVLFGEDPYPTNETFYAGVFTDAAYTDLYALVPLVMDGSSETLAVLTKITLGEHPEDGVTYYVTETDENGVPLVNGTGLEYHVTVEGSEVYLSGNGPVGYVTITNTYPEEEESEVESEVETETEKETEKPAPRTGDDTNYWMYLFLMTLALGAISIAVVQKRREKSAR